MLLDILSACMGSFLGVTIVTRLFKYLCFGKLERKKRAFLIFGSSCIFIFVMTSFTMPLLDAIIKYFPWLLVWLTVDIMRKEKATPISKEESSV